MLGPDMLGAEPLRLGERRLDDLLHARRERHLGRRRTGLPGRRRGADGGTRPQQIDAQLVQRSAGHTFTFADQTEQEVLDADVVVVHADGLVLREREHALRTVVEPIERSHRYLLGARWQRGQWNVPRPPTTVRTTSAPQRGHGSPAWSYTLNSSCIRPCLPRASR